MKSAITTVLAIRYPGQEYRNTVFNSSTFEEQPNLGAMPEEVLFLRLVWGLIQ